MGVIGCCPGRYQIISKFQRRASFALKIKVIFQVKSRHTVAFVIVISLRCDRIAVCIYQCHQFSCNSRLFYCCLASKNPHYFLSNVIFSVDKQRITYNIDVKNCVEFTY